MKYDSEKPLMTRHAVLKTFQYKKRNYSITYEKSDADGNESIQLNEKISVAEKPFRFLMQATGNFTKIEPLIFACRNRDENEVEISMQYEGLPFKPVQLFFREIEARWIT